MTVARLQTCGPDDLWVHRKGAQSAGLGEPGLIPGSMGTASFHVTGKGCPASLASSSHGAGRTMSRSEARRRITRRQFESDTAGVWFDHRLLDRLREKALARTRTSTRSCAPSTT